MEPRYFVLRLNPEPWAVGSVTGGRQNGKIIGRVSPNPNLVAFQSAVKEELEGEEPLPDGEYKLTFYFWRELVAYLDAADHKRHRNQADATNMQKGLEDALQGVLFDNDRHVRDIRSVIAVQNRNVDPCIVIKAELFKPAPMLSEIAALPTWVHQLRKGPTSVPSDNVWRGPNA